MQSLSGTLSSPFDAKRLNRRQLMVRLSQPGSKSLNGTGLLPNNFRLSESRKVIVRQAHLFKTNRQKSSWGILGEENLQDC